MEEDTQQQELSLCESARRIGLSRPTLREYIRRGNLLATPQTNGSFRIKIEDLAQFQSWYSLRSATSRSNSTPITELSIETCRVIRALILVGGETAASVADKYQLTQRSIVSALIRNDLPAENLESTRELINWHFAGGGELAHKRKHLANTNERLAEVQDLLARAVSILSEVPK